LCVVLATVAITLAKEKHHRNNKVVPHHAVRGNHTPGHCKKTFHGCTIDEGKCVCSRAKGCTNPFPYKNMKECKGDQMGKRNVCLHDPCKNGECTQVIHNPKGLRSYHCECAGSGYYGRRCQHKCPKKTIPLPRNYPPACVDI